MSWKLNFVLPNFVSLTRLGCHYCQFFCEVLFFSLFCANFGLTCVTKASLFSVLHLHQCIAWFSCICFGCKPNLDNNNWYYQTSVIKLVTSNCPSLGKQVKYIANGKASLFLSANRMEADASWSYRIFVRQTLVSTCSIDQTEHPLNVLFSRVGICWDTVFTFSTLL